MIFTGSIFHAARSLIVVSPLSQINIEMIIAHVEIATRRNSIAIAGPFIRDIRLYLSK